jgi:hypothetical protein
MSRRVAGYTPGRVGGRTILHGENQSSAALWRRGGAGGSAGRTAAGADMVPRVVVSEGTGKWRANMSQAR